MKPTEVSLRFRDLIPYHRYQFVIDAANVIQTINCEVTNTDSNKIWPVMLKLDDGEFLFVKEEECRNVRLLCPECDSALFERRIDDIICFDCGWGVPDQREDVWNA